MVEIRSSQIIKPTSESKPVRRTTTFGDTLSASYGRTFGPVVDQLGYYTSESDYDPESFNRVDSYISKQGLSGFEASYLRTYGIGSQENFDRSVSFLNRQREIKDDLAASSGLNLMINDPAFHASLMFPIAGIGATTGIRSALGAMQSQATRSGASKILEQRLRSEFGDQLSDVVSFAPEALRTVKGVGPVVQKRIQDAGVLGRPVNLAANSWSQLSGKNLSAKQVGKIAALDAAVADGSINLTDAMNELNINADPVQTIKNAALLTAGVSLFSYGLGYGLGMLAGAKSLNKSRTEVFKERYKTYLKQISEEPKKSDMSYAGSWFTNSVFMKAVPTPVRDTINNLKLPDWAKDELLQVGGDNGMVFAAHKIGKTLGTPVFVAAARRNGDWFSALNTINESYRKVSSRGQAEFLNIPVGEYYERIRRTIGKDSFAPDEWYNHVGRLMADDVPYDKMTPEEAASVQAARGFFEKYRVELEEVGLINARDVFTDRYVKEIDRQNELMSVSRSIVEQNKRWMQGHVDNLQKGLDSKMAKLADLESKYDQRGLTQNQQQLMQQLDDEIADLKDKKAYFDEKFDTINNANGIDEILEQLNELDLTDKMADALAKNKKALAEVRARAENASEMIERGRGMEPSNYLFRVFNRRKIEKDRDAFRQILIDHFRDNNEIIGTDQKGLFKVTKLPTDDASLAKRAEQTINNILGETDEDAIDAIFTGFGRNGPLISRRLNIPNSKVKDYIVTDIKELMIGYTTRVAPKIEYHKRFRNPENGRLMTLEARLDYLRNMLKKENVPDREIDKYIKNYVSVYDQVVGTTLKRPDAIDTKIANFLRTSATWTFLSGSGVAAIGDASSLFMDHELSVIGRGFLGLMDDVSLKLGKKEANLAGEALEIVRGTTQLKYLESLSNDIFTKTVPDRLNNAFFIANLLAPVTVAIKSMDALLRSHTIIEASINKTKGKATKFEVEFLARYNIDDKLAEKISTMPYEKSNGGLYLANTEAWTNDSVTEAFRNALNSGIMNRVIMGTPADKPMMMNGVAYIPDSIASKLPFDLPTDPRVPGYRRAESGLLALPFTFYSYTMGALSKITANHAAGSVRNRLSHIAVAMGLGYMIVKYRTPSFAWDDMDFEDKIARSFDFSGLAAIHSDMAYRMLAMHNELGFESNFPIQPKYQGEADALGAVLSLGGAPVDWGYSMSKAITEMVSGNFSDGAKDLISITPLLENMLIGDVLKETAKDIVGTSVNRP